jgi:drug/metabolite transporter (DMT)-like permease
MASTQDYLKLHFIVFLWGFSAILGKFVQIPAVEMVLFRAILAAAGMGIVILVSKGRFAVTTGELIRLVSIGFIVALHWISFFGSARVSNVSVSLVGFATNSLWAALLEPWFNNTKMKKYEIVLGCVVVAGLYIIFSFDFQYKLGLAIAIVGGFTSALFSCFNSKFVQTIPARTITFYEMIGVFIAAALFLPFYQQWWAEGNVLHLSPSATDWICIALLSGVCSFTLTP